MIAVYRAKIEKTITRAVSAPPNHGWEDAIQAIYAERDRVELDFIGGVLADPLAGMAMAAQAGVDHSLIFDDALWVFYAAATICRDMGHLTGERFADGMIVARAAKAGLAAEGFWDDSDHRTFVHGTIFGPESLEAIFNSWPSSATVPHFAAQLIAVNRRIDSAREHLRIARELIEGREAA